MSDEDRYDRLMRYMDEIEFALGRGDSILSMKARINQCEFIIATTPDSGKDNIWTRWRDAIADLVKRLQIEERTAAAQCNAGARYAKWNRPGMCPYPSTDCNA